MYICQQPKGKGKFSPFTFHLYFLSLDSPHRNTFCEVFLEDEEDNDDRHGSYSRSCHDQPEVCGVFTLQLGNTQGNRQVAGGSQHDQLHEIIIPGVDEGEDGEGTDTGFDHREDDLEKCPQFARAVNGSCFQNLGRNAFGKLFDQEYSE